MGSDSTGSSLLHLQWNSYSTCWHTALSTLRTTGQFCDLTLVVDDGHLPAHRVVVTSCSPLLARALAVCHHPHPAVVLRGVNMLQMKGILDFMYMGETRVEQGALETFLKSAEDLCVTGLTGSTEDCSEHEEKNGIFEDVIIEKTPLKRPNPSPSSASPKSKKVKNDEMKVKKPRQKKPKKDSSPKNQQKDEEKVKSSTLKEGYEETAPTDDVLGVDSPADKEVAEPVIVFKKVFSPKKNCAKPDKNGMESPKKQKVNESPIKVSGNGDDEVTVTLTPSKKKVKSKVDNCSGDGPSNSAERNIFASPKRRSSPAGPPQAASPEKYSPDDGSVMTNLPHDRAKLRDIWDTLVAPEDIEGEIVYSCLCCEKTFKGKSAKSNAWSHVDHNHTPHIEHKCHICDFTSKSNDGVSRHISKSHKKEQAKKEDQKNEGDDEEDMIVLD